MKNYILIVLILIVYGCNNTPKNFNQALEEVDKKEVLELNTLSVAEGTALLKLNCYSCHNPNSVSHDNMLAPPLAGIQYKYKEMYPDRTEFVAKMASFLKNPSKENALMKGPVRRFGLMPVTQLPKKQLLEIAAFIYDEQLDAPSWFPKHFEEAHNKKWTQ